ncbi:hypothetical protein D3C76_1586980 [compost metagenome]
MILPVSTTEAVAVKETVEVSTVSLTLVTAAVPLTARFSKLPPEALVIRALTEPASM